MSLFTGTDADGSRINETATQDSPTINKIYEMLHTIELHNQSFNSNLNISYNFDTTPVCCQINDTDQKVDVKNIEGAIVNNITEIDNKSRKRRVVKLIQAEVNATAYAGKKKIEVASTVLPLNLHANERRRRPGETGSSAPLLNYIFDTYSNPHHHKNDR